MEKIFKHLHYSLPNWFFFAFVLGLVGAIEASAQGKTPERTPRISCRQAVVSPNPLQQGQPGSLAFTISNEGIAPFTGLLKCEWVNLGSGRVDELPQAIFNGVLNPGQFHTLVHHSNPIISPPGFYQMRVVDGNGRVLEKCTSQIFTVISASKMPDLKVQTLEVPRTLFPGEQISIKVKVRNQGAWKSSGFKGRLYWDIINSFGASSLPLGGEDIWPALGATSSIAKSVAKTLPIDLPNGKIYFFYIVDWDREIGESDETNNSSSSQCVAAFRLALVEPIGYVPYPNTPRGVTVATDLNLVNTSKVTFSGTLAVSLLSPQDSFLMDLATWENINIAPTQGTTFSTGIKTSPMLNFPVAKGYKIHARYRSGRSQSYSTIPVGKCTGCLNPFRINIVPPGLGSGSMQTTKVTSRGSRGAVRMSF